VNLEPIAGGRHDHEAPFLLAGELEISLADLAVELEAL